MKWLFLLCIAFSAGEARAQLKEYQPNVCKDLDLMVKEAIELELAGQRWVGGSSPCLKKMQWRTIASVKNTAAGDEYLLDPEYILPKNRNYLILKKSWNDVLSELTVFFTYIGKKNGKDVPLKDPDHLVLKLNSAKKVATEGCFTIPVHPEHFVMREQCYYH